MTLEDALQDADISDLRDAERRLAVTRRQLADAKAARDEYELRCEKAERELSLMLRLDQTRSVVPKWLTKQPKAGKRHATPWLLLSDLHLDETVNAAEVAGVNAYSRAIAELRLKATFQQTVEICQHYMAGMTFDGFVLVLAGDLYSGDIHEELTQTNADTMLGSILHWHDHLAAGITLLADTFGRVHVPVVVGNHSRRTRKPRAKFRARDNFDWFTGHLLARHFAHDKRVTFQVGDAADAMVDSYSQRVCVTHGDQARGGAGIAGIYSPISRLDARKRQRANAISQPYDLLVMGHWHSLIFGPQWIVNGSLKGYDEYAAVENFSFEEPQQALWLMTPEHGKTFTAPVLPMNRKAEGW